MADVFRHMAVGLQSSGKTTYAAALWYVVDAGEVPTVLLKGKHIGDHRYLETLARRWEDGWQVPRTKTLQHETVTMNLKDPRSGADIALRFADLSGETFEKAFATRSLSSSAASSFDGIQNLMLFVSANDPPDHLTMIDIAMELDEDVNEEEIDEDSSEEPVFDSAKTPRQVQIVDFLDSIRQPPLSVKIERVAVIVSAWDKRPEHNDPARWLTERMGLLDQYLRNSGVKLRVYGVSAQGGDLPDKDNPPAVGDLEGLKEQHRLLSLAKASKRVEVAGNGASEHDLTHPIRWLSGLEGE
ncbi:TRAFAC clade GTPase domain-containing protein [Rhizobium ruizarguesonis]|uniref:TRAFAC clade GTPase domain-containing protein n=1 Tax=Rhizobium ruizarguesonis TaxID=2081791 RepID=UPI00102F841C|nr:hypothetical protein [Rhizobium ruizarguesonis]TBB71759.1 hypothetical protein ELH45_14930 [Rhizobium ruizarguesonis]